MTRAVYITVERQKLIAALTSEPGNDCVTLAVTSRVITITDATDRAHIIPSASTWPDQPSTGELFA